MSSHAGNDSKNYTKHAPQIGKKYLQNGAKKTSKTIPETLTKKGPKRYPKVFRKAPQNEPKKEFKITKKRFGWPFSHLKKTTIFRKVFFLVFCAPQDALDPQNQAKTM